jgi:predicted transcriptional regulator
MSDSFTNATLFDLTAQIVSAHVSKNSTQADALPALIQSVFKSLSDVGAPETPDVVRPEPAVPVKRSVFADHIVCLEDGKKLKMLKRHLATSYQMTPDQYRQRWNLPRDYPMVAPDYAARRSALAKSIGLGRQRSKAPTPAKPSAKLGTRKMKPKRA